MLTPNAPSEAPRPAPENISYSQPAGPKAVGAMLHTRREELGRELRAAADVLRIRYPYLHAIEEGRVEDLPGPTYAVGFVRAYADYLGLDGEYIVARFKLENEGLEHHRAQLVFPSPTSETRVPSGAILLIAVALAAAAYGGWVYLSSSERNIADLVPSLPDNLTALLRSSPPPPAAPGALSESAEARPADMSAAAVTLAPASPTVSGMARPAEPAMPAPPVPAPSSPPAQASAPPAVAVQAPAPAPPTAAAPSLVVPPPGTPAAPAMVPASPPSSMASAAQDPAPDSAPEPPDPVNPNATIPDSPPLPAVAAAAPPRPDVVPDSEQRPEARIYGEENLGSRIVIRALSDSWVEVRDERSGELLLTRVLRTGDTYRVPNRGGLSLVTGNAGGIEISVDGKSVGSIGPLGSVRRNLALDPDSLRRASAAN
ncbi:MAG: helix-turn-helix domain-containing protein [Alphaproteobacteria bacterium]